MNPTLKRFAERVLLQPPLTRLARRRRRHDVLVLAYHNIVPDGRTVRGDESLHLPQREFARQLDLLAEDHEVIPLSAVRGTPAPASRPRVVVTFDDAYHGAMTVGIAELARRGLTATVFVAPALLGGYGWWDRVELAESTEGAAVRDHALHQLQGREDRVIPWAASQRVLRPQPDEGTRIATESELATAAASRTVGVACHTWSHPNLATLSDPDVEKELSMARDWLRARFADAIDWLAYPYGLSDRRVRELTQRSGFAGALRVDGGWLEARTATDWWNVPRFNVPAGISIDGFRLRASGVFAR